MIVVYVTEIEQKAFGQHGVKIQEDPIRHQTLIKHGADEDINMSALLSLLLQIIDSILISTPWCLRSVLVIFESELDSQINF
jgi:hypothetical protein